MKLLLDACVWGGALGTVQAAGHDVVWAGQWQENPSDEEIIARAAGEARILVTLDKDFGELAVVHRRPHAGIVRLVGFGASDQGRKIIETVNRCLNTNSRSTVSAGVAGRPRRPLCGRR